MRVKASVIGLAAKDMKPGLFENAQVTKQPFGQWSNDFYGWARRVNESYQQMLKVAAKLEEWNEQKYQEDFELVVTAEEGEQAKFDEECLDMLRLQWKRDTCAIVNVEMLM